VAIDVVVVEVVATDFCIVVEGDSVGEDVIVKVFSPLQRNLEPSTDIPKAMIIIIATETATRNQRGNPIHRHQSNQSTFRKYKCFYYNPITQV
jgi:hypothetical protein